eukprot:GILK01007861.1.p1 GENE.GILK01007861.1~~GILK01007861.1.p1  ORF type:complete len:717 (-),score=142.24 GILK01007861.1:247-2397(-)
MDATQPLVLTFAESLWDGFDNVANKSRDGRKTLEEFVQILKDRAATEETYARGLEKIYQNPWGQAEIGTVKTGLDACKADVGHRAEQARALVEAINNDILEPLQILLRDQTATNKKVHTEGKRLIKDLKTSFEKVDKAQARYIRACQESEVAHNEHVKASNDASMAPRDRNKYASRNSVCAKEADLAAQAYADAVTEINQVRKRHDEMMNRILEVYQKMEETRIETIKDALRKFVVYETSSLRNLQYDITAVAESMEQVSASEDIKLFIEQTRTGQVPPPPVEFIPYTGAATIQRTVSEPTLDMKSVVNSLGGLFSDVFGRSSSFSFSPTAHTTATVEELLQKEREQQMINFMSAILDDLWRSEILLEERKMQCVVSFQDPGNRRTFVRCLNTQRSKASFDISGPCFEQLAILMAQLLDQIYISLLDQVERTMDVVTGKYAMILSQTFYRVSTVTHQREFLQSKLNRHPLWENLRFWEAALFDTIQEEMEKHKMTRKWRFLADDEQKDMEDRQKNITFGQLGSFSYNMLAFGVPKAQVKGLITKICHTNELGSEYQNILLSNLDNVDDEGVPIPVGPQRGIPQWLTQIEGPDKTKRDRSSSVSGTTTPMEGTQFDLDRAVESHPNFYHNSTYANSRDRFSIDSNEVVAQEGERSSASQSQVIFDASKLYQHSGSNPTTPVKPLTQEHNGPATAVQSTPPSENSNVDGLSQADTHSS